MLMLNFQIKGFWCEFYVRKNCFTGNKWEGRLQTCHIAIHHWAIYVCVHFGGNVD